MLPSPHTSKLFHSVVLMGCALVPATGCGKESPSQHCGRADGGVPEAGPAEEGDAGPDAGVGACDDGWPPTK